jgi:hypothetical protein
VNGYYNTLTATVPLGQPAYYNVVNPVTNTVYVAGFSGSSITVGNTVSANGNSNITTLTSPSITIHAGSRIFVMIQTFTTSSSVTYTVSDTSGNSYSAATALHTVVSGADWEQVQIFYTPTPLSTTVSLTVTVNTSVAGYLSFGVLEIVGPSFTIVPGTAATGSNNSSVSISVTATANSLVLGAVGVLATGGISNPGGFTVSSGALVLEANAGTITAVLGLENTSYASGSITMSGTVTSTGVYWVGIAIALEPTFYTPNIAVVNGTYNTLVASIPASGSSNGLAINANTNTLFVSGASISVLNCFTNTIIASIPVTSPNALVVNPSTNLLYASTTANLYVVNCSNYQIVATISTSSTTIGQFEVNTALNTLYYQNGSSFSILNGYTNTNVATVTNSNTGTYYISSNSSDPTFNVYNSNNTTSFQVHGINGNFNGGGINSAAGNAFYPTSTNSMSSGAPYNLWTTTYTQNVNAGNTNGGTLNVYGGLNGTASNNVINLGTSSNVQTINFSGNVVPSADNTYNIGSSSDRASTVYTENVNSGSSTLTLTSSATSGSGIVIQDGSGGGTFINSDYCVVQDVTNGGNTLAVRTSSGTGIFTVSAVAAQVNIGSVGTNVPINYNLNHCVDAIGVYEFVSTVTTVSGAANATGYLSYPSGKSQSNVRIIEAIMYDGTNCIPPNYVNNNGFSYSAVANSSGIACFTNTTWTQTGSKTFYIWVWMT